MVLAYEVRDLNNCRHYLILRNHRKPARSEIDELLTLELRTKAAPARMHVAICLSSSPIRHEELRGSDEKSDLKKPMVINIATGVESKPT